MANGLFNVVHEVWKPIPGHLRYEASNLGRIRSLDEFVIYRNGARHLHRGRVLRQFTLWNGYKTTHLGAKHMNNYVHHLVAEAWLGERPKGLDVCHNNNDKSFNWIINLRFDSRKGNMDDRPIKWVRMVNGVADVA